MTATFQGGTNVALIGLYISSLTACCQFRKVLMIAQNYTAVIFFLLFYYVGGGINGAVLAKEAEPSPDPFKVLILSTYHNGYQWSDDLITAIGERLKNKHPDLQLYLEYMHSKRFTIDDNHHALYRIYKHRYGNIQFDVLIAADDNALYFMRYYRELFNNSPIVFCSIRNIDPDTILNRNQITGVVERLDALPTIEVALSLHPAIRSIYVLGDRRSTHIIKRQVVGDLRRPLSPLEIISLSASQLKSIDLLESLGRLPSDAIVLVTSIFGSIENGEPLDKNLQEQICRTSPVPVYALDTQWLGTGVVGGKMFSGKALGVVTAKIVLRLLDGQTTADIPIHTDSTSSYMFDYRQLQRFGIDVKRLPVQSEVINRKISWYHKHRPLVWLWSASFMVLLAAVAGFLLTIYRRQQAESALRKSERTLQSIFRAAPIGIGLTQERVLRWTNNQLSEITGFTASEMLGKSARLLYPDEQEFKRVGEVKYQQIHELGTGTVETLWRHKDGRLRDILLSSAPLTPGDLSGGVIFTALDITERKATEAALRRQSHYMTALHETALGLVRRMDLKKLLKSIVAKAVQLSNAQSGFIWIYDDHREELAIKVAAGKYKERLLGNTLKPGEGIAGRVWQTGEPLMVDDYSAWQGRSPDPKYDSLHAALGVPIKTKFKLSGVIGLGQFDSKEAFQPEILPLMHHFAELVSIALDNAELYARLQNELNERRRVQKRLRISEDRFRTLYRHTPGMLHSIDSTGCLTEVSDYWLKIMGYSKHEVLGQKLTSFMTKSSRQYAEGEVLPRFFKQGSVKDIHYRFVKKKGQIIDVLLSAIAEKDDEGQMIRSLAISVDVTQRLEMEKALAASQKELASILNNVPDVIFRLDENERITYISDSITRYGHSANTLLGTRFLDMVQEKDKEAVTNHMLERKGRDGHLKSLEAHLLSKDQQAVPFEIFSIVTEDHRIGASGQMAKRLCIQGIARDITDRRKAQQEQLYREKLQAVLELAGAVCHELHQPMQSVAGYGELLLISKSLDQAYEIRVKKLTEQIHRMAQITQKLQKITRYETKDYLKGKIIDIDKATRKSPY
jgi:PAS domain S-box-containing protein